MLKNYLKIAMRNLWRHKGFSFLNILGLAVGMAAFFLILMYVTFELSYDRFHSKRDRIYRVVADIKTPTETLEAGGPAWAVPPNIKDEFPEVEQFVRWTDDNLLIRKDNIKFMESGAIWADSSFFKVFDFPLVKGNPNTALTDLFNVVLSESTAKKYFGKQDPMGQTLLITGDAHPAKVTGIMKDFPENSHFKADLVLSMSTITKKFAPNLDSQWGNYGMRAYLLLAPGSNPRNLQKKFPAFLEKRNGTEMKQSQMVPTLFLESLNDVYLRPRKGGAMNNVYIFSVVAAFILVIACINFVNLTTARSVERAKEVGIRKVAGAEKHELARQFIGESVLICLFAFVFAVGLTAIFLPGFNQLAGKIISKGILTDPKLLALLLGIAVIIGMLAGLYPAGVLSSFQPITVLKGRFTTGTKGILLRKGLVISQFTISIALIIATIVVFNQMQYMREKDLGFKKDQMLIIDTNGDPAKHTLRESLNSIPGIKATAMSGSVPGGGNPGAYSEIENTKGDLQIANLDLYFVDFDYLKLYDIKVLAGRGFSREFKTDTTDAMILNEAAIKMFGYRSPKEAVGKRFKQWGREGKIVGVIQDFNFRSLEEPVKPLSMRIEGRDPWNYISVNVSTSNLSSTLSAVENKWKQYIPNRPFSYFFLDEFFNRQYKGVEQFGNLFLNFAILAIFISCLGLLGLASYSTVQRTKEIGIRKVLGANVGTIVGLLSRDFLKLVLLAFVLAAPVAWFAMYKWLGNFAYRTPITWTIFAGAGMLALVIAFVTVSFQATKAAITNPIKSLRTE